MYIGLINKGGHRDSADNLPAAYSEPNAAPITDATQARPVGRPGLFGAAEGTSLPSVALDRRRKLNIVVPSEILREVPSNPGGSWKHIGAGETRSRHGGGGLSAEQAGAVIGNRSPNARGFN